MGRNWSPRPITMPRVATAVRLDADVHEALHETADAFTVSVNWLVNRLCREGLERMDLSGLKS